MTRTAATLLVLAVFLLFSSVWAQPGTGKYKEQLVFFDDFHTLDTAIWKHAITLTGGGNWEFQQYVNNRSCSWVDDGVLYLKPMLTEDYIGGSISQSGASIDLWGLEAPDYCTSNFQYGCFRSASPGYVLNPLTSARVRTAESFSFKYGRVEVRAKAPRGDWLWPAIWLMPRYNQWGPWPQSGEIDIMESRGNVKYKEYGQGGGIETYSATMHWGNSFFANGWSLTHELRSLEGRDFADDFHTYGLYWDEERIVYYLDDPNDVVMEVDTTIPFWERANKGGLNWEGRFFNPWLTQKGTNAPFDQEFFLIMNTAVGATNGYFSDSIPYKPWKNTSPNAFSEFWNAKDQWLSTWKGNDTALRVDSVKIWVFPEISTYTFNNRTNAQMYVSDASGLASAGKQQSLFWPYFIGIGALLLSLLASAAAVFAVALVLGYRLKKDKKLKGKKRVEERRVDQPMAGGSIELHEETHTEMAH